MPIHEYQCPDCNARFEELTQSATDTPPPCPACGGGMVRKLFPTTASTGGGRPSSRGCDPRGGFS